MQAASPGTARALRVWQLLLLKAVPRSVPQKPREWRGGDSGNCASRPQDQLALSRSLLQPATPPLAPQLSVTSVFAPQLSETSVVAPQLSVTSVFDTAP